MTSKNLKKVFVKTFGCQMNVYDSEKMIDLIKPLGYTLTDDIEQADLAILNTCHIREKAEQKVYSDLGRIRPVKERRLANDQQMIIAVAGCVAQAEGEEIVRQAPYVDVVVGPQAYHNLPKMIALAERKRDGEKGPGRGIINTDFPVESKFDSLPEQTESQAAAFLSVQEGCDKFCAFCVVPYTRGAEYSRPVTDVIADAKRLVSLGTLEINLLGQNVNAYHGAAPSGKGTWTLGELIRELAEIDGLRRIRYTTSHPRDMEDTLIQAHGDVDKLMPYLHLPVQSGSDNILKAMNRKHGRDMYFEIIEKLRVVRPDIAMSSDFIVGFPGESERDFQDTLDLVRRVNYAQAYSFKYSPRPGTPGALMDLQVPEKLKTERIIALQELLNEQQLQANRALTGQTLPVLLERKGKVPGQLVGRSPYMQSVHVIAPDRLIGKVLDIDIIEAHSNSLGGVLKQFDVEHAA